MHSTGVAVQHSESVQIILPISDHNMRTMWMWSQFDVPVFALTDHLLDAYRFQPTKKQMQRCCSPNSSMPILHNNVGN
jgi:hypothetical protein